MRLTDRGWFVLMALTAVLVILASVLLTRVQEAPASDPIYGYDCDGPHRLKEARCPQDER